MEKDYIQSFREAHAEESKIIRNVLEEEHDAVMDDLDELVVGSKRQEDDREVKYLMERARALRKFLGGMPDLEFKEILDGEREE